MYRKFRILVLLAAFALFLDFTGTVHAYLGFLAKIQFLPAMLAVNVAVIAVLVLLTLIFGRVYCSVICPLGIFQDVISHFSGMRKGKRWRFGYVRGVPWLRYLMLAVLVASIVAGAGSITALLDPYASFGRIVSNLFAPIYKWGNNLLAYFAERAGSYAFYDTDVYIASIPAFVIAAVMLVIIAVLAWRGGRTYCNSFCPVGTLLGLLSRFSLMRPVIDSGKCVGCKLCARGCKSSCIDIDNKKIDYSRCVVCLDCIDNCRHGAVSYRSRFRKRTAGETDAGRRNFMAVAAMAATSAVLKGQEMKVDGGLAAVEKKQVPHRDNPLVPAGSWSVASFSDKCVGCQLCVSVCPNKVLRPSVALDRLMQPEMSYEKGFCRPECTKCSEVCPAGAITPVTRAEKSSIRIGKATLLYDNCIAYSDNVSCGNCSRHCPAHAIHMVMRSQGSGRTVKIPVVNTEKCIGCGACEYVCPARPLSAIYVEGYDRHSIK